MGTVEGRTFQRLAGAHRWGPRGQKGASAVGDQDLILFLLRAPGQGFLSCPVVMTEFAQIWKDRLTCPRLAYPPHLHWLTSWHHGRGEKFPFATQTAPPIPT